MKSVYKIFLVILIIRGISNAQIVSSDSSYRWFNLNYSVPESPAFKILDVTANDIMRPTSTKDIAISIGNYYLNNGATIPKNITMEISPALLNPSISLEEYCNNSLWYTSSYSLGTKFNSDGSYYIAVGAKVKLIDHADIRTDRKLLDFLSRKNPEYADSLEKATNKVAEDYAKENGTNVYDELIIVAQAYSDPNNKMHEKVKSDIDKKIFEKFDVNEISRFREERKKALWNAVVWDLGIAALVASRDSLIEHISAPSKIGIWTTYGCPMGPMGQFLLGLNTQVMDNNEGILNTWSCNVGCRVYYGRNDTKGFIHGESIYNKSKLPSYQACVGIETTFAGSIWIEFSLGIKKTGSQPFAFTPGINIAYATPEKNK